MSFSKASSCLLMRRCRAARSRTRRCPGSWERTGWGRARIMGTQEERSWGGPSISSQPPDPTSETPPGDRSLLAGITQPPLWASHLHRDLNVPLLHAQQPHFLPQRTRAGHMDRHSSFSPPSNRSVCAPLPPGPTVKPDLPPDSSPSLHPASLTPCPPQNFPFTRKTAKLSQVNPASQ